jgi:NTP pyrophosphatase (non-canonical NTP hydrolase)
MTHDLEKEYASALRDGRTEEATEVARKIHGDREVETSDTDGKYEDLKGVGDELADEIRQVYGDYSNFVEEADVESLSDISGIGETRAESLLEQVE